MADAPVIFKRKGAKRSQRARDLDVGNNAQEPVPNAAIVVVSSGSGDGTEDGGREDFPSVLAAKLKNKHKSRMKPKSNLSFGGPEDNEGEEVFQVKKSKLSSKLMLNKQTDSVVEATSNSGPTYSAAYLNQLKASTPSSRPRFDTDQSMDNLSDVDVSVTADSLAQSSLQPLVDFTADIDMDDSTAIPSNSSIQAAKDKRERLRKGPSGPGTGEDYISLSLTKRDDFSQGPHPESRLAREEDDLGEGDDEFAEYTSAKERIALGKKSRKVEAQKRRAEMNELIADAEEQDEETMEWEQEQLRRGGLRTEGTSEKQPKPVYKPAPIPTPTPIPTLAPAITRLTHALTALTTSHAQQTASMVSLSDERQKLEAREKELREVIEKAEEKRAWFGRFTEWMDGVAGFLDEKYKGLEAVETEEVSLLKEKWEMVDKRRASEDGDDIVLVFGEIQGQQGGTEEEIDETGRVVPNANSTIARRERKASRAARHAARLTRQPPTSPEGEEGFSTDSSLPPSDASDYALALRTLHTEKLPVILADVRASEFRHPEKGLAKWFGEWREKWEESYVGAWGGVSMVGAWEFWARVEMVGWNPVGGVNRSMSGVHGAGMERFEWYRALYAYSRPPKAKAGSFEEDEEEVLGERELGPDGDLVSAMITTAVIPRVVKLIEGGALDPYSTRDVKRLIDFVEEVEVSVDRQDLKFQTLLKAVYTNFATSVSQLRTLLSPYISPTSSLPLRPAPFTPDAIPARRRFLNRRLKLLENILRWRKFTGERFGIGVIAVEVVEKVVIPVAEGGWEIGGEEVAKRAASMLPKELVPLTLKARLGIV